MLRRHYLEQGTSKSALARRLGVHRDTIHRWIRDGGLDRDLDGEAVRYGPRRPVATTLDAYRPIVEARLAAYPQLSAVRLLEEIRAAGDTGGYSQLKAKAVITRDLRLHGGALVHNPEFLRFAHHWGVTPRACRPYRAQTKGNVERPVRDLREHLVYGRTFLNDADLGQQCADWLGRVAHARCHATTQERPRERFDRDERAALSLKTPSKSVARFPAQLASLWVCGESRHAGDVVGGEGGIRSRRIRSPQRLRQDRNRQNPLEPPET